MAPPEFSVGESTLLSEGLGEYEALRTFFLAAEHRGHPATSVVLDDAGRVVTHPLYCDRMGTFHPGADAWAFVRRPRAEALGLVGGTDWVRDHSLHLMFVGGSVFLPAPHLYDQPYVEAGPAGQTLPLAPVCTTDAVAWANDGRRVAIAETRLGAVVEQPSAARHLVWDYDVVSGDRRVITALPTALGLRIFELTYSPHDDWLLLNDWPSGRSFVIRVADGFVVELPLSAQAVNWDPSRGSSALLVMEPSFEPGGGVRLSDFNLTTNELAVRRVIRSNHGDPLLVRELQVHPDGNRALVVAPTGTSTIDQARRGGVMMATVVDLDNGGLDTTMPVSLGVRGAERRHTSPRWTNGRSLLSTPAEIDAGLLATGDFFRHAGDDPAITVDTAGRWTETAEGIASAWERKRLPAPLLAREFVQFATAAEEAGDPSLGPSLDWLRTAARIDPALRRVERLLELTRSNGMWSLAADDLPADAVTAYASVPDEDTAPLADKHLDAVERLISAETVGDAQTAAQGLANLAPSPRTAWTWLAARTRAAASSGQYAAAVTVALAVTLWVDVYVPQSPSLASSGLGVPSAHAETAILVAGFAGAVHLPEHDSVGGDRGGYFDVQQARERIQQRLNSLDVAGYLLRTGSPDRWGIDLVARSVETARATRPNPEVPPVLTPKVFISYVHEDRELVERFDDALRSRGLRTWRDSALRPADWWRSMITRRIGEVDFFVACFSSRVEQRGKSYMYEEIRLAIDEIRKMPHGRRWFVPVKFDDCDVPDFRIDAVDGLEAIHHIELYPDWQKGVDLVCDTLLGIGDTNDH